MIKNIIFDMSEVIISGYFGVEEILEKDYSIPADEFIKRKQIDTLELFLDTMRGKHSEDEYCSYLLEGTNWNISIDELKKVFRRNLNIPVPGVMQIIKELKNKYKLILLSDYVKEWKEWLFERNFELSIFDYMYFSYEYKKLKSDEGTFQFIMNTLNLKTEETIFIDDLEQNVANAQKNGIAGIVFKDASQLRDELHNLNVL